MENPQKSTEKHLYLAPDVAELLVAKSEDLRISQSALANLILKSSLESGAREVTRVLEGAKRFG